MAKVTIATAGRMQIGLFDPGMTAIHRAGLGGLWMTLEAIEHEPVVSSRLQGMGVQWSRGADYVAFEWSSDPDTFFQELLRQSFRLTPDGRFWFMGIGDPRGHLDGGLTLQDALLTTYLQHGRTRDADPSSGPDGTAVLEIDSEQFVQRFRRVRWYNHHKASTDFSVTRPVSLAGWQLPGGAVRHVAFTGATALSDQPAAALALWFAPVGCVYFRVRRWAAAMRPQFCLVIPDLDDLNTYARARRLFLRTPVRDFVVAGTADAGVRAMATIEGAGLLAGRGFAGCDVVTFGVAPWSPQQKTRLDVLRVNALSARSLALYRTAQALMPALLVKANGKETSTKQDLDWAVSPVLDLAARNLVLGTPWWLGFAAVQVDVDSRRQFRGYEAVLRDQQTSRTSTTGGIRALVARTEAIPDPGARALVDACHEAWKRRLGALGERARDRGESFPDLASREQERLRVAFARCKNAATLRAALTDFWSRAGGPLQPLQEDWTSVLPFFTEARWQEGRDLALLALASYQGSADESQHDGQGGN